MSRAACYMCEKRHRGCHDVCDEYQATRKSYEPVFDEERAYSFEKRWKLKKKYGGRD